MDASTEVFADPDIAGENENPVNQEQVHDADLVAGGEEKRWPGWPGESVFRILVPSHKVGSIIGRKGEFIKKMCEESRARIKILDGPQGATVRAVIISAKEEQDASISPAMDGLLRVHKRIVDGLDGELAAPPVAGQTTPTRLLVPATQAGTLIGKQGATIKSIQEASKSVVRILEELPPVALQDDRVVEIQGEPAGVHKAVEIIASHLRKFLVDRTVLPLFEVNISMQHPPHMEQHMHQNMPPPQPWDQRHRPLPPNAGGAPGYGNNPQFMHQRPHDNFYPPPDFTVEKPPHHGISTYGRDAPAMGAHSYLPSQVSTHHMQIPLSYADAVIGASGSNISYIRRSSGAAITIQESRGAPGEMTVEINGSGTQIQTAQQLIQNFIAGAAAAAAPPAQGPGPNTMAPADQGYGSYATHGPPYSSQTNAGPAAHNGGGYASAYGTNYGY